MTRVVQLFFLIAFFAFIFFIVTRVLGISVSVGTSPDTPEAFSETIGAPIDLIIVGPDVDAAALRQLIIATDESGLINQETVPTELAYANAVVFLLNDWQEINTAPWQEALRSDYDMVRDNDADTFSMSVTTISGARPVQLSFYNTAFFPDWDLKCYAEMFVHGVSNGDEVSFSPPAECPI